MLNIQEWKKERIAGFTSCINKYTIVAINPKKIVFRLQTSFSETQYILFDIFIISN